MSRRHRELTGPVRVTHLSGVQEQISNSTAMDVIILTKRHKPINSLSGLNAKAHQSGLTLLATSVKMTRSATLLPAHLSAVSLR